MKLRIAVLSLALMSLLSIVPLARAGSVVPKSMTGAWSGHAQIIVVWCKQTNLQVQLNIKPDGEVTGRVGDATLRNGRFSTNRSWLERKLNLKTDYIVTGDLEGSIVAAETITRRAVFIPLNYKDGVFAGGVHTSGTHLGGKKSMVLSAAGLTLKPEASD